MKHPKVVRSFALILCVFALSGCNLAFWKPKPVSAYNDMPDTEQWCYKTLGDVECYPTPQDIPAERLVNVYPQSRHPMSPEEYKRAVAKQR